MYRSRADEKGLYQIRTLMSPVSWREEGRLVARERPPVLRKQRRGRWLTEGRRKHANIARESIPIDNADAENDLFWAFCLKHLVRTDINVWRVSLTLLIKRVPLQEVFMACSK